MSHVILPDSMKAKFLAADAPLEIFTADGIRIGYFTPAPQKKYNLQPPGTDEDLDARFAEGGGRPLKDILRDLEKRA
jgi:hypothetical protein